MLELCFDMSTCGALRRERTERPRIRSQPHRGRRKCDIYYGHRLR